jgi:hypothetical protein
MKKMLFLLLTALPLAAHAQDAFSKFESDVNVASVVVGPKTFAMVREAKWKDGDKSETAKQLVAQMDLLKVYATKNPETAAQLKSAFAGYAKTGGLEPLIKVNDSGHQISIMVRQGKTANLISEILAFADGGKGESVLVSLTGNFDMDRISEILSDKSVTGDKTADAAQFDAIKKQLQLKVSPNPASDVFYLDTDQPVRINLFDATGKIVKSETYTASGVNVAGLPKGIYLLEMTSADKKQTEKLIVK